MCALRMLCARMLVFFFLSDTVQKKQTSIKIKIVANHCHIQDYNNPNA